MRRSRGGGHHVKGRLREKNAHAPMTKRTLNTADPRWCRIHVGFGDEDADERGEEFRRSPAAMNVAPATSSSMPYRSTSTSKAGTKKSSHTLAMATKVYSTPNACRKTAPRRSCDSVNKSGGYREPSPSDLSRRRPDACARRPRLSERAEPALTSDPNAPVAEPQVTHATRNAHAARARDAAAPPRRGRPPRAPRGRRDHPGERSTARAHAWKWAGRRSDRCRSVRAFMCRIRPRSHAHVALYAGSQRRYSD